MKKNISATNKLIAETLIDAIVKRKEQIDIKIILEKLTLTQIKDLYNELDKSIMESIDAKIKLINQK